MSDHYFEHEPFNSLDTHICKKCVIDPVLGEVVKDNLRTKHCDYCGKRSKRNIAAPFDSVMEIICSSISKSYADAQEIDIPSVEGGWLCKEVEVWEIIGEYDPGWETKLFDDISYSLGTDKYWVAHHDDDWTLSNPAKALRFGWDQFKYQIMHKTRYLFLNEPIDELNAHRRDYIPVKYMLDALHDLVIRHNLIKTIPMDTPFYRVRVVKKEQELSQFKDIALPPYENATAGRLNPAGIPYFYLACNISTAISETITKSNIKYGLAEFRTKENLRILDLVKLPIPPSIFSPSEIDRLYETYFIRDFQKEIIKPIKKDGREHIDYVPTQIVAEYFRYRFKDPEGKEIDGIKYPSSKNNNGYNVVLFVSDNNTAQNIIDLKSIKMKTHKVK